MQFYFDLKKIFTDDSNESEIEEEKVHTISQRGRKCKPISILLHAKFNEFAKEIIQHGELMIPSKSDIYKKIAEQVGTHINHQTVYQAAKRYFVKRIPNLLKQKKTQDECEDYVWAVDKYDLQSKQHNKFELNIRGIYLFRNENGDKKKVMNGRRCFEK